MADSHRDSGGVLLYKPPRSFRKRKSSSLDEDDASPSIPKPKITAASQHHSLPLRLLHRDPGHRNPPRAHPQAHRISNLKLGAASSCSKVSKGINSYTDYKAGFRREQTVAGEKASGAHGPLRASPHIRMSTRFDYQPDICKDYKETEYCKFGDACKFLHDRANYKLGWLLEKEWEEIEKEKAQKLAMKGEIRGEDEKAAEMKLMMRMLCRSRALYVEAV